MTRFTCTLLTALLLASAVSLPTAATEEDPYLWLEDVQGEKALAWVRERWSVHVTNLALACLFGTLILLLGWQQVLMVHLPIMVVSSILGVWLFSLQHRFETAHWTTRGEWNFVDAALRGSSWFDLPRALHWLTGNIGFHHVHHLNPHVPNYRLSEAHRAVQALRPLRPLSFGRGLAASFLTLWDQERGRLVSFHEVRPKLDPLAGRV